MTLLFQWFLSFFLFFFLKTIRTTNAFTLITFDVDGTLVKGSGQAAAESAHAKAFAHAVGTVLGDGKPVTKVADALPASTFCVFVGWLH